MDQMTDAPESSPEIEAARDRFFKLQDRTAKNFSYGATNEALAIAQGSYERLSVVLKAEMDKPVQATKGWDEKTLMLLKMIPPQKIALAALNCALQAVVGGDCYTTACEKTGELLRHELFSEQVETHDKKLKKEIEEWAKEKHGNLKYRLQAARSLAKRKGFSFVIKWKASQHVAVGHFVLDILLSALPDLFDTYHDGNTRMLAVTDGAHKIAEQAVKDHVRRYPIFLPSEEPPVPWTGFNQGGPADPISRRIAVLVRTFHRETIAAVGAAIKSGQMQPALDALNSVQAVPWTINSYLARVMRACQERGFAVDGVPSLEDIPLSDTSETWETMTDDEKKQTRRERAQIKQANRKLDRDRLQFGMDMETADVLSNLTQFYIPHNLDWRGREYPMTNFHFQREDHIRALFLFKEGEPIGEEGIAWLKVHLANCGDFGKVSKKSYEERIKWVDENLERIRDCAEQDWDRGGPLTPEALSFWTQADKPFLFLAACIELTKALEHGPDYVCGLPCSWDGSCSGLQHLCAMTRSEDGRYVNLTDVPEPDDVYQRVADAAFKSMEVSEDPAAKMILAYQGNRRKMFKRNVMTTFYGSKKFGMAQQHMTDLMEPLQQEVILKKRKDHPFGTTFQEQNAASRYLAQAACDAIGEIADLPMKAMEFIQSLAGALAHVGKPLEWVTPVGLPWSNRYHGPTTEIVRLWMHDHGVKRPTRILVANGFQKNIDKHRSINGSAPNFVHACDAAHLLRTVNAAVLEGIKQLALVHDSFGSLPSHAARFQGIIREQFVEMYEQHDVLTEVLERAKCDLIEHENRLSAIEERRKALYGSLNIKEVLKARYAFA